MGSAQPTIRVAIVDDDVAFAEALGLAMSLTPHLEVVGRAHESTEAHELVLAARPDLVVCDYRLQDSATGIDTARRLRRDGYDRPIVILTSYLAPQVRREVETIPRTVAMSKREQITTLITNFGRVASGTYTAPLDEPAMALTEVELEVLELVNAGKAAAQIAQELHISVHTVRSRLKSLMRKLDVSSQGEAVAEATRLGLLVPPS